MTEEKQKSYLIVQFESPNSVLFNASIEGVSAMQMLSIASYLEVLAKRRIAQELEIKEHYEQQEKLIVPENRIAVANR